MSLCQQVDSRAGGVVVGEGLASDLGRRFHADQFVFACGPWLPKLFPDALGTRIFPTRQEVFYFATPPGDQLSRCAKLPAWIDFTDPRCPYGFRDLEARGVKLAFDLHGEPSIRIRRSAIRQRGAGS